MLRDGVTTPPQHERPDGKNSFLIEQLFLSCSLCEYLDVRRLCIKSVPLLNLSLREKLKQLKEDNFNFLTDLYNQAGDICQLKVGRQRIVFINHPDYAKHILQTNLSNYPKDNFYSLAEQIIGKNILTTNDQVYWSEHRKIIAGLFQPQSVKGMGADIIDVVNEYSTSIQRGQTICLNQLTTTLALKIITRLLFSKAISEDNIVQLAELLSYFGTLLIKKRQPLSLTAPIYCNTTFWKNHSKLKTLIKSIIKATHDSTKADLISLLTEYQCPHSGNSFCNFIIANN